MATALPAALGLKRSHFAGSSTARTGGSKIGTARKIHLVEAGTQQNRGRGEAGLRGGSEWRNLLCVDACYLSPSKSKVPKSFRADLVPSPIGAHRTPASPLCPDVYTFQLACASRADGHRKLNTLE